MFIRNTFETKYLSIWTTQIAGILNIKLYFQVLQYSAELYLSNVMAAANLLPNHSKCTTLKKDDIVLLFKLREVFKQMD